VQADDLNVPKGRSAELVKQLFSRDQFQRANVFALRAMESRQARLAALPVPLDPTRMSPAARNVLRAHLDLQPMELAQFHRPLVMR